ncbi:DNA double-strand break repair nuclease NurA [Candidatus Micrarchaeota archaeon]|nr:DNA double-strand break repair nuclease NurA [Candidatus Micrarchaeota archaeon]
MNLVIGAVDSGMIAKEFMGFDIISLRAIGGLYSYNNDNLTNVSYYPSKYPNPEMIFVHGSEKDYSFKKRSIIRLTSELKIANILAEEHHPDIILLDGSVAPLPCDKPSESDDEAFDSYNRLIELYKSLYKTCYEKGINLAGIVKDTRGRVFLNNMKHLNLPENINDIFFLNVCLSKGEMVKPILYGAGTHPTIEDISLPWPIKVTYMSPSEYDSVLRVEIVEFNDDSVKTFNDVYNLSSMSNKFAYPPPLIDIDLHARLRSEDLLFLDNQSKLMGLIKRRNRRPF